MTDERKLSPVERIFERMSATYMIEWSRKVGQTPIADLMTVWEHELSGFMQSREAMMAIAWALENLPESAPNVIQFRNLCRMAPSQETQRLDEPKADPERVRAQLEKLAPLREKLATVESKDCKAWARKILAEQAAGIRRTPTVVQMARNAIGIQ